MIEIPYEKMICDSDYGDGGVYFYETYLQWVNRSTGKGFKIDYLDIQDINLVPTGKKKITIILKNGEKKNLYLYRADTFLSILKSAIDKAQGKKEEPIEAEVTPVEEENVDDITKLERLAKLHESGALTDEEFIKAKQKILG